MKKQKNRYCIIKCMIYILCLMVLSCGYGFAPKGEYIDKRIQNIYVEPFDNKTPQAGIENYVRTAFINQILLTSRFKTVSSMEAADAIIKGSVLNINTAPLSYGANILVAEERATVIVEVNFREKESSKTIWSSKNVTGSVDYKMENNINMFPAARKQALIKLSEDMAEKAFNMMMAGF
jgi:hypothetical protein